MANFVIVGMGAAGFGAAQVLRRLRPDAVITVITDEPCGYYSRPGLAYLLSGEVPEKQLFPISQERWKQLAIRQVVGRAVSIAPETRQVAMVDGRRLDYDALLLATGAAAIPLKLPDSDADGIVTLDSMEDARHILQRARRVRDAVVVGGGITALEIAEGLQARNVHVHYLMRGDRYWRNVLDETESRLVERRLAAEGVDIHHHTEIGRILSKKNWRGRPVVTAVETNHGQVIHCQMVAVAIGVRPRLDLVAGSAIETDRGILVNERLESAQPGVYAAGDVAQVYDSLTGRAQLDVLWPTAVAQGRVAGSNMAGMPTIYQRRVQHNVTRLAGMLVAIMGTVGSRSAPDPDLITLSRGDSEVWRGIPDVIVVHDRHEINRQRLVIKGNHLVGAVIIGDQSFSSMVYRLIQDQTDIGPYLPALRSPRVDLGGILRQIQSRVPSRGTL